MKFSPIVLVLLLSTIGVSCLNYGYTYQPYYVPVLAKGNARRGGNLEWFILVFVFLIALFPNLFGALGSGLQNFAGALTGNGGGNNSYNGGGNVPPVMGG